MMMATISIRPRLIPPVNAAPPFEGSKNLHKAKSKMIAPPVVNMTSSVTSTTWKALMNIAVGLASASVIKAFSRQQQTDNCHQQPHQIEPAAAEKRFNKSEAGKDSPQSEDESQEIPESFH